MCFPVLRNIIKVFSVLAAVVLPVACHAGDGRFRLKYNVYYHCLSVYRECRDSVAPPHENFYSQPYRTAVFGRPVQPSGRMSATVSVLEKALGKYSLSVGGRYPKAGSVADGALELYLSMRLAEGYYGSLIRDVSDVKTAFSAGRPSARTSMALSRAYLAAGDVFRAGEHFSRVGKDVAPDARFKEEYAEIAAMLDEAAGRRYDAAEKFMSLARNYPARPLRELRAFEAARLYLSCGEKGLARRVYSSLSEGKGPFAVYARLCAGMCFEPLDEEPDELLEMLSVLCGEGYDAGIRRMAFFLRGQVRMQSVDFSGASADYASAALVPGGTKEFAAQCRRAQAAAEAAGGNYQQAVIAASQAMVSAGMTSGVYYALEKERAAYACLAAYSSDTGNTCAQDAPRMLYSAIKAFSDLGMDKKASAARDSLLDAYPESPQARYVLVGDIPEDVCEREYSFLLAVFLREEYTEAEKLAEKFLEEYPSHMLAEKCELVKAVCRGHLYGNGALVRSLRRIADIYRGFSAGEYAEKALETIAVREM